MTSRVSAFGNPAAPAQADLEAYAEYLREAKGILDIRTFHRSGVGPNFLDVVVVSAGFTKDQMGDFHNACRQLTKAMLSKQPWHRYQGIVNIHAVFVGDESPASTRVQASGYDGHVMGCDEGLAVEYSRYAANSAATVVMHNSEYSSGGTGTWGVAAINKGQARDAMVPIHELGHGLAGLGDEYIQYGDKPFDGDPNSLRDTVNVTATADPKLCKWHYWTEEEWPGLFEPSKRPEATSVANFEGAGWIKKIYRPEKACYMRCDRDAFCVVCNETLEANFFRYIDLFQATEPLNEEVVLWKGEHINVRVSAIDLLHQPPEWLKSRLNLYLDGEQVATSDRGEVCYRFPPVGSEPGTHHLAANLNVQSRGVRRDFGFLSRNRGWRVRDLPWTRPKIALMPRVSVSPAGIVDVPVEIKHEEPDRFDLTMSHAPPRAVLEKGRFQWKPAGATGAWRVDFTASREGQHAVVESLEIHVAPAENDAEAIEVQPLGPIEAVTGKKVMLRLKASANSGGHILFKPVHVPTGVELDRYTGDLSWTPSTDQAGPIRMRFRAQAGRAMRETEVLFRVRRAATPSPVSYCNDYIPRTLEALNQLKQSPIVYRRLFETLRLLRDRYEPVYQKALAEAKSLYQELGPKLRNNCLQDLFLHAWAFTDKPDILNWMREIAHAEKSGDARVLAQRLELVARYNANRTRGRK